MFPPELHLLLFDAEVERGVAPQHLCLVDWLVGEHGSPSTPVHGRRLCECHERPIPEVVVGVDDQRWCVHCVTCWNLEGAHWTKLKVKMRQYFEGRDLHGRPFVIGPLGQDVVAGLSDAVQRAVQMGKLVEFHTSAPGTLDHPLLQVIRGVGVVVQDVPFLKG